MTSDRNTARDVVDRLVAAYNAKDAVGHAELFADDARYWSPLSDWLEGRERISEHVRELFAELPDEQMRIVRRATDGDTAVIEVASSGTTPAGDPYELEFTEVIEFAADRIGEIRVYLDPDEVAALG